MSGRDRAVGIQQGRQCCGLAQQRSAEEAGPAGAFWDLQEGMKQWGGGGGEKVPRREKARVAWERN